MAGQEREVCLFTFAQGCYILGEMQDLMKEDFLKLKGEKLSAAQSSQGSGPEGKEFNKQVCPLQRQGEEQ